MAKSYRKFLAGAATTAVVASSFAGVAGAASFSDVESKYQAAVDYLVSKGINGFPNGTFGTHENIKRVDAAVFVAKALGLDTKNAPDAGFTDVPDRAKGAVNALKEAGITSGKTATTFGSSDLITRGELAVWISKGFDLKPSYLSLPFSDVDGQYKEAVSTLVSHDITKGISASKFGTWDHAKRGDFAIFLLKADKASKVTPPPAPVPEEVITIKAADNKGNSLKNNEKKTYTVTVINPVSGKPQPNALVNVTFAENVGTDAGSKRNVTVTDAYGNVEGIPYQADTKDGAVEVVAIAADQHGKATFTISGANASVTPIVFLDGTNQKWDTKGGFEYDPKDGRFDKNLEFYAQAETVSFSLESYALSVTAKGDKFAALAERVGNDVQHNGREFTVTVLKEDGQPFAGGTVHAGINEILDQNPGNDPSAAYLVGNTNGIVTLKLDSKGQAKVVLASTAQNDFATPIFWVDQNKNNLPNTFEKSIVGETTNFQEARVQATAKLEVKDLTLRENVKEFEFTILNQSGKEFPTDWYRDKDAQASFEVKNTGSHAVQVLDKDLNTVVATIAPNKTATIPVRDVTNDRTLRVTSQGGPSSVEVSANAVIKWYENDRSRNVAVTAPTQKATLNYSVDVKQPSAELRLVSVTPEDKNGNGTPEQFVFKFNTAISGAEAGDFRLNGQSERASSAVELRDGDKEVVVKFAESHVNSSSTINYDGSFINGDVVVKDGFGNTVRPFNVPKTGY